MENGGEEPSARSAPDVQSPPSSGHRREKRVYRKVIRFDSRLFHTFQVRPIGKGSYGVVHLVRCDNDDNFYVMKIVKYSEKGNTRSRQLLHGCRQTGTTPKIPAFARHPGLPPASRKRATWVFVPPWEPVRDVFQEPLSVLPYASNKR